VKRRKNGLFEWIDGSNREGSMFIKKGETDWFRLLTAELRDEQLRIINSDEEPI